jgi:hypothetical protein
MFLRCSIAEWWQLERMTFCKTRNYSSSLTQTSFGKKFDQQAYLMNQASVFVVLLRVGAQQHEVALQGVEIFELK